jgi:hypothetical protein
MASKGGDGGKERLDGESGPAELTEPPPPLPGVLHRSALALRQRIRSWWHPYIPCIFPLGLHFYSETMSTKLVLCPHLNESIAASPTPVQSPGYSSSTSRLHWPHSVSSSVSPHSGKDIALRSRHQEIRQLGVEYLYVL